MGRNAENVMSCLRDAAFNNVETKGNGHHSCNLNGQTGEQMYTGKLCAIPPSNREIDCVILTFTYYILHKSGEQMTFNTL